MQEFKDSQLATISLSLKKNLPMMNSLQALFLNFGFSKSLSHRAGPNRCPEMLASRYSESSLARYNTITMRIKKKQREDRKNSNKKPKKRIKTPRGPLVFTRGFLDGCANTDLRVTVEELPLETHLSDIDYEVSLESTGFEFAWWLTDHQQGCVFCPRHAGRMMC